MEALRRNGMTDLPLSDVDVGQPQDIIDGQARSGDDNATPAVSVQNISQSKGSESIASNPSAPVSRNATGRSPKSRKSVSFAKDTKIGGASTPQPRSMKGMKDKINQAKTPQLNDDGITQDPVVDSEKPGTILHGEEDATFNPVIPTNEAPEDAALRQDMIQYNMGEVGAIVAELDFDEDETTNSDDESGGEDYDGSSVEDEEDQFGRTRRRVLTNGYLAEMQKLQERLKNIGPLSTRGDVPLANSGDLNLEHSQNAVSNDSPQLPSPLAKKEVRFANELDIQDAHTKATTNPLLSASHASKPPDVHRKPTHTPKVIERPFMTSTSSSKPNEPDEYDPALIHQEVMTEYHRMRNHVIQRQGGFNARDEDEESGEVPLTEAEGGPRKLSRFKAARLGKLGA